jgi:hypothetical protein
MMFVLVLGLAAEATYLDLELSLTRELISDLKLKLKYLQDIDPSLDFPAASSNWQPHLQPDLPINLRSELQLNSSAVSLDYFSFRPVKQYRQGAD